MGIFGNRNKNRIYTLGKAMKLAQDPKYGDYEFEAVDPNNIQAGYRIIPKEQVERHIEEIKRNSKRSQEFENRITGNGNYKNIKQKVNCQPYNQYQKAKRYQPEKFEIR